MSLWDYPVRYAYGNVPGYSGFHTGEDRPAPIGTSITVNGIQIGTVGSTGKSTGPHTHIGRWQGGTHTNPQGGGETLGTDAEVTQIDTVGKTDNGRFVRVRSQGVDWLYLHMDTVTAKVGDKLTKKGNDMYPNGGDIQNFYARTGWPGHYPNDNDIAYWTTGTGNDGWSAGADNVWKDLTYSVTLFVLNKPTDDAQEKLNKVKEIVNE